MSNPWKPSDFDTVLALTIHDIKNSLSMLLEKLDRLSPQLDAISDDCNCRYEIRRINNNLVSLLGVYRLGAECYVPYFDHHPLAEMFQELADVYRPNLQARGMHLEVDCDPQLWGYLDKGSVSAILENALNNAMRYGREKLYLRAAVSEASGDLQLEVIDDGRGFPQELIDQANRIHQLPHPGGTQSATGLGLYFAHQIAAMHRVDGNSGHLRLENLDDEQGGIFRLSLPQDLHQELSFDDIL